MADEVSCTCRCHAAVAFAMGANDVEIVFVTIMTVGLADPVAIVTACDACKQAHHRAYFAPKPFEAPKPYEGPDPDQQADGD